MLKIESKAKLAKLLAMEDLDIQHKQVKTAMFDVKNRILILPTWKDMPNDLYDLLVGHEVGHALYTPNNENQLKDLIKKSSKHCVNVVEDARIEKLIKNRYPGLVKSFYKGYKHLIAKDFFGLSQIDFDTINLLDKLNLYFKVPNAVVGVIEFDKTEQVFVDRIEKIKKFEELDSICVDICDYIKENRTEEEKEEIEEANQKEDSDESGESDEYSDSDDYSDSGDDAENEESEQGSSDEESDESEESDDGEEESDDGDKGDESGKKENSAVGNGNPDYDKPRYNTPEDLKSKTQDNFEKELAKLNDVETENEYVTLPKEIRDDNINDYKKVWNNFNEYYNIKSYREILSQGDDALRAKYDWGFDNEVAFIDQSKFIFKQAKETVEEIKKNSSKNVAHMAMEFERKKCADVYKRTLIAKTGVLDTNKLFSAKYNEDVFKKSVRVPDGKNHGLCMFIDWSGSMASNMQGCIRQLIELILFCKKVNIPFEVYSFTDVGTQNGSCEKKNSFGYRHGDLVIDEKVTLNNYFSSRMNTKAFNEALINICVISNSFRGGYQHYPIPEQDRLGYTPLNGAIIASEKIIKDFRKKNAVEKVHAVWITDGEGNNSYEKYSIETPSTRLKINRYSKQLIIQDEVMKKNYKVKGRYLTPHIFDIIKDRLGCNIVGFFLDSQFGSKGAMLKHWYQAPESEGFQNQRRHQPRYGGVPVKANEWMQKAKKDGFIVKTVGGYDEYYVISDKPVNIKTNEIDEKMTARKMATIFSANSTKFKKSRVILSRFIDLITV